ncbi:MAG: hypothetical protein ACRCSU_07010 [Paracoccaceae bacterium]
MTSYIQNTILLGVVAMIAWIFWNVIRPKKDGPKRGSSGDDAAGRNHTRPERNDDGHAGGGFD